MKYWSVVLALVLFGLSAQAEGIHDDPFDYRPADPSAAEVSASNLLGSERFWPYLVALEAPLERGKGMNALAPPLRGVLIRVNANGTARLDFGRDGIHDVATSQTDLLARANEIREGNASKVAPNFAYSVGPRLLDAAPDLASPISLSRASSYERFVTVFADPADAQLEAIAAATRAMHERAGTLVVFFPVSELPDTEVRQILRALDWKVTFAYGHLAEGYRDSLVGSDEVLPRVAVHSREGRLLFESSWDEGARERLEAAVAERSVAGQN